MIVVFGTCLLFLILSACGIGTEGKRAFSKRISAKDGYCSREMTASINGYFLTTVFMAHLIQYMPENIYGPLDFMYIDVNRALGQLIVAMFLFYSGYGVMESIRYKKGYIVSFLKRRCLPFLVNFEIAALIYFYVLCLTGQVPTFHYAIKGFLAWESFGNSNWYVFAIFYLYLATYVVFRLRECRCFSRIPLAAAVFGVVFFSRGDFFLDREEGKRPRWFHRINLYF